MALRKQVVNMLASGGHWEGNCQQNGQQCEVRRLVVER